MISIAALSFPHKSSLHAWTFLPGPSVFKRLLRYVALMKLVNSNTLRAVDTRMPAEIICRKASYGKVQHMLWPKQLNPHEGTGKRCIGSARKNRYKTKRCKKDLPELP